MSFDSIIVPLLRDNHMAKSLHMNFSYHTFPRRSNFPMIKAAFMANQGLEDLRISGDIGIHTNIDVWMLFQDIAAAPKIRKLSLDLEGVQMSFREQNLMLANALQICENNTLERFHYLDCEFHCCNEAALHPELMSILRLNRATSFSTPRQQLLGRRTLFSSSLACTND
jgi:hypothetical protein